MIIFGQTCYKHATPAQMINIKNVQIPFIPHGREDTMAKQSAKIKKIPFTIYRVCWNKVVIHVVPWIVIHVSQSSQNYYFYIIHGWAVWINSENISIVWNIFVTSLRSLYQSSFTKRESSRAQAKWPNTPFTYCLVGKSLFWLVHVPTTRSTFPCIVASCTRVYR